MAGQSSNDKRVSERRAPCRYFLSVFQIVHNGPVLLIFLEINHLQIPLKDQP